MSQRLIEFHSVTCKETITNCLLYIKKFFSLHCSFLWMIKVWHFLLSKVNRCIFTTTNVSCVERTIHCHLKQEALLLQRNRATRYVSRNIMAVFLTELLTRSSANPEEPCEHTVSWNRVQCCTNVRRIACEKVCNRWMTFKVIQGHCRCHHLIGHRLFPISLPL